jgi:signal transduction histidine kinase
MDEIYQLIKPQLSQKRVEWDLANGDIATKEFWVNGISDQLKQVFINLSTNAIDAMQPDGGLLKVTLKKGKNHEVGVALSDTGPGIDPEYMSRIFEPFFSTKNQGLGLGLSICYDIIQRHQGHIEVSSISGKGSTFEVWLPEFDDANAMKGNYGTTS